MRENLHQTIHAVAIRYSRAVSEESSITQRTTAARLHDQRIELDDPTTRLKRQRGPPHSVATLTFVCFQRRSQTHLHSTDAVPWRRRSCPVKGPLDECRSWPRQPRAASRGCCIDMLFHHVCTVTNQKTPGIHLQARTNPIQNKGRCVYNPAKTDGQPAGAIRNHRKCLTANKSCMFVILGQCARPFQRPRNRSK